MTKNNMLSAIRMASFAALAFLLGWAVLLFMQALRWAGLIDVTMGGGAYLFSITWFDDSLGRTLQCIELVGYFASSIAFIALLATFILRGLSTLKASKVFSARNVRCLWAITVVAFFFKLFATNCPLLFGLRSIEFSDEMVVSPLMFLIITLMYQLAVYASEENELTI